MTEEQTVSNDGLPPPSGLEMDGVGFRVSELDRFIVRQGDIQGPGLPLGHAQFISVNNQGIYITVDYAFGGVVTAYLLGKGESWRIQVRTEPPYDVYCFSKKGPCTPSGALTCIGGRTYHVG